MATALTILLCVLSAGILAGRIYEITALTDLQTGFFIYKGIVFSPYILAMFVVITICCAIVIFGADKTVKPFFSHSSKIIAAAAGAMLIIYGLMSLKNGFTAAAVTAGGIAFAVTGITALNDKLNAKNVAVTVLFVVFIAGLCLDVIVLNVATVYNIEFTKNALSYIAAALLIMFVLKNAFSPTAYSRMLLYISGILAFVFCGIMNIADIVSMAMADSIVLPDLFFHAGFGFVGFFGLDNAVSAIPKSSKEKTEQPQTEKEINDEPVQAVTAVQQIAEKESSAETEKTEQQPNSYTTFAQSIYTKTEEMPKAEITVTEKKNTVETKLKFRADSRNSAEKKSSGKTVYKKPK